MDNFKERNEVYKQTCENECMYYSNSIKAIETEIYFLKERMKLDKKMLKLCQDNLENFCKGIGE